MNKSLILIILLSGCAAHSLNKGAKVIQILPNNSAKEVANCTFLGEGVGSQGNYLNHDFITFNNMMRGARNEAINQAYDLGANVVEIKEMKKLYSVLSNDLTNITVTVNAYDCLKLKY